MTMLPILILICSVIGTPGFAKDITPIYLKTDEHGLQWYETPVNNGVFAIAFQLDGTFELAASEDDFIAFFFTGRLTQVVSGNQLGSSGGQAGIIKCEVVHLPIRIQGWSDAESKTWGPTLMTFQEARNTFQKAEKYSLRVALRQPKYCIISNGDLATIEASQFYFKPHEK